MKHLKILGLAALAATALMAVSGAGAASATVICKTQITEGCAASGWAYPVGTEGTASLRAGTSALLETLGGSVLITCTESTVKSTLAKAGSAATTVESGVSTLTFAKCTNSVVVLKPGKAELHWIPGTDNGTLTTIGTEVTVNTIFGSCIYGTGPSLDAGITEGGNPGKMKLNVVVPKVGGGFACPAEARATAEYGATSPTNAWVAGS